MGHTRWSRRERRTPSRSCTEAILRTFARRRRAMTACRRRGFFVAPEATDMGDNGSLFGTPRQGGGRRWFMIRSSFDPSILSAALVVVSVGCKSAPGDSRPAPAQSAASAVASTVTAVAAPSPGGGICDPQPYPRRCDPACKSAHARALASTCGAQTRAFISAVPDQMELGKCLVGCRKAGTDSTCVGAADKAGCECQLACYRSLPADARDQAEAAERCYAQAIAAACGG